MTTDIASTDILLTSREKGIATLTLNRPARRNSLSEAMMTELHAALEDEGDRAETRVIVLAGEGPGFCAGHDLKELTAHRNDSDRGRNYFAKIMAQCSTLMQAIVTCPKPVLARVHGIATAAGCQLVASCDLAIASETARFATPGVNIGLFCSTPMVALSRNLGRKQAMEMLLTGDMISAQQARDWGLINRVVPDEELDDAIAQLAGQIASKSSHTLAIGKKAFYEQGQMSLGSAYDYASEVMVRNMLAHDAEEGINAFLEKRDPTWEDR